MNSCDSNGELRVFSFHEPNFRENSRRHTKGARKLLSLVFKIEGGSTSSPRFQAAYG